MSSVNLHIIVGRLGRDPEMSDKEVCKMSVATSRREKNGEEKTQWHNVVCFGTTAKNCAKYLKKGSLAYFEGEVRTREYEQDGQKKFWTETVSFRVQFLSSKNDEGGVAASAGPAPSGPTCGGAQEDDLPF